MIALNTAPQPPVLESLADDLTSALHYSLTTPPRHSPPPKSTWNNSPSLARSTSSTDPPSAARSSVGPRIMSTHPASRQARSTWMWTTTNERGSTHWDCWTKKERVSGGRKMRRLRVEIGVVGGGGHWVRCLFVFHVMYQTHLGLTTPL